MSHRPLSPEEACEKGIAAVLAKERIRDREKKRRNYRTLQVVCVLLALCSLYLIFRIPVRPIQVAAIPTAFIFLLLRAFDRDYLSTHQNFTLGIFFTIAIAGLVRVMLPLF
ncbi:hypothetical protein [Roseibacillus persicicus]|uniref:hypothetical protein n=1 Tax=Roseibacillus persicicus TaxID=454148 RepID=UPI00280D909A|nr:hypothetical protein [Roseibacillus persicicus]MDQ8190024.1 hypothetical protein [Roseibacillus persicicus]